jgi:hypothetical protein
MRVAVEQGVPQEERPETVPERSPSVGKPVPGNAASTRVTPGKAAAAKPALGNLTDWDAARIFLEVVRSGSFRSAAERLSLSINAVRRRIGDFERQVGSTLFTRDVHGARLTDEGALVVSAVERM